MSYITFEFAGLSISGKTKRWSVKSNGVTLGAVSWYSHWRTYTFFPNEGTTFDSTCLGDIIRFLDEQNKSHRCIVN